MDIIIGRGNKRLAITVPCAEVLKKDQNKHSLQQAHIDLCYLVGISPIIGRNQRLPSGA